MIGATSVWLFAAWVGAATASERCTFGPPVHPRPTPEAPARVLLEMRIPVDTPIARIDEALAPLTKAGLPVVLLFATGWKSDMPAWRPPTGTEVGIWTSPADLLASDVADLTAVSDAEWRDAFKAAKRSVTQATQTRPVAVATSPLPPAGEVALDDRGFSVLLVLDPTDTALPRRARAFGNRMGRTRVLSEGIASDDCGARLGTPPPSALDRVTLTAASAVVARVALAPDADEARAVALWWTTTAQPADWKAWSVRTAFVRLGTSQLAPKVSDAPPRALAVVDADDLLSAARIIANTERLPRTLPGGLNLTETFVGLTAMAVDPGHLRYTIPVVEPASDPAQTMRSDAVPLDPAELRAAAGMLLPRLDRQAPGLVTVGNQTLSAGEFLVAIAQLALDQPPVARPVRSPDPYAPGGGWGAVRSR